MGKIENKLELIKYLHEPRTRSDCQNYVNVNERTLRYYNEEGDIEIGNVIIPYEVITSTRGRTLSNSVENNEVDEKTGDVHSKKVDKSELNLRTTVHPIILPLNLTEVYLMTVGLLDTIGKDHEMYDIYLDIANKIYSQLSPYAKSRFNNRNHEFTQLDFVKYTSEEEMRRKHGNFSISMAIKLEKDVEILTYTDEILRGRISETKFGYYLTNEQIRTPIDKIGIKEFKIIGYDENGN